MPPPINQDFKGDLAIYRPLSRNRQYVALPNRKIPGYAPGWLSCLVVLKNTNNEQLRYEFLSKRINWFYY